MPSPEPPQEPDMTGICSKCAIMDIYLSELKTRHKTEAKQPPAPIVVPDTNPLNRRMRL